MNKFITVPITVHKSCYINTVGLGALFADLIVDGILIERANLQYHLNEQVIPFSVGRDGYNDVHYPLHFGLLKRNTDVKVRLKVKHGYNVSINVVTAIDCEQVTKYVSDNKLVLDCFWYKKIPFKIVYNSGKMYGGVLGNNLINYKH